MPVDAKGDNFFGFPKPDAICIPLAGKKLLRQWWTVVEVTCFFADNSNFTVKTVCTQTLCSA
jgi:hypothetical protein